MIRDSEILLQDRHIQQLAVLEVRIHSDRGGGRVVERTIAELRLFAWLGRDFVVALALERRGLRGLGKVWPAVGGELRALCGGAAGAGAGATEAEKGEGEREEGFGVPF